MISASAPHPASVGEADFVAAQRVRAARATNDGTSGRYRLSGLMGCRECGRRMDSHWVHGRAGYRRRHGYASSKPRRLNEVKNVYVREDVLLEELMARLPPAEAGREPDAAPVAADRMISELRASGRMVVHDGSGWVLGPRPGGWPSPARRGVILCPRESATETQHTCSMQVSIRLSIQEGPTAVPVHRPAVRRCFGARPRSGARCRGESA